MKATVFSIGVSGVYLTLAVWYFLLLPDICGCFCHASPSKIKKQNKNTPEYIVKETTDGELLWLERLDVRVDVKTPKFLRLSNFRKKTNKQKKTTLSVFSDSAEIIIIFFPKMTPLLKSDNQQLSAFNCVKTRSETEREAFNGINHHVLTVCHRSPRLWSHTR